MGGCACIKDMGTGEDKRGIGTGAVSCGGGGWGCIPRVEGGGGGGR